LFVPGIHTQEIQRNGYTPAQQAALDALFDSRLAVRVYTDLQNDGVKVPGEMVTEEVGKFSTNKRRARR
jgi:hypothetical protein